MAIIDLSQLKDHKPALIHTVQNSYCKIRLLELGFLPGKAIQVIRRSPLGHTLFIKTSTGSFAIRKNEALSIKVQLI